MRTYGYTLSGRYEVTKTYILKSNFRPPTKRGFSIYLEITYAYVSTYIGVIRIKKMKILKNVK